MTSRALWLSLCLAVLGASVPLRESVAAEARVDLEAYIGDIPMQDDSRTYLSELGDDNTDTAIGVSPGAKRTGLMFSSTNAAGDYVSTEFDVVVHGKKLLVGTRTINALTFFTKKPKKVVSFRLKPGKAYPFSISSKVFLDGEKVGKGKEYGKVTFVGFEEVTTPLGTFPDAAHFRRTNNLRVKSGKQSVESKVTAESWVVAGLGPVKYIQSEQLLENKVVTDSSGPTEWFLDHGVALGEPFPVEAAAATVPMPWVLSGAGASASGSAESSLHLQITFTPAPGDAVPPAFFVVESAGAGIDLINADATVITQEFVGLTAQAPGALVGTRTGDGVVYSQPLPER